MLLPPLVSTRHYTASVLLLRVSSRKACMHRLRCFHSSSSSGSSKSSSSSGNSSTSSSSSVSETDLTLQSDLTLMNPILVKTKYATLPLYPPPSLNKNRHRIHLDPPQDARTPPPQWMLTYFPSFFERDEPGHFDPEQHREPLGVMGVYGYLISVVVTAGLVMAHFHERFMTNDLELARAALLENRIQEEMTKLIKEKQKENQQQEEQSLTLAGRTAS